MAILDPVKYNNGAASDKRSLAVSAALELILTKASSGDTSLARELDHLSAYADKIQAALKYE